jgi:hypothetical protein
MKAAIFSILFWCQCLFFINTSFAQVKRVVFVNKKTHLRDIFRLPHPAAINLVDDKPWFFSNVILDSVNHDTFYIHNPNNKMQCLAVPFSAVNKINVRKRLFGGLLTAFWGYMFTFGAINFLSEANRTSSYGNGVTRDALYFNAFLFAGTAFTIFFSGPKRKYDFINYEVKNTYR